MRETQFIQVEEINDCWACLIALSSISAALTLTLSLTLVHLTIHSFSGLEREREKKRDDVQSIIWIGKTVRTMFCLFRFALIRKWKFSPSNRAKHVNAGKTIKLSILLLSDVSKESEREKNWVGE